MVDYPSLQEALRTARDEHVDTCKELAKAGLGYMMVARVRDVDGRNELDSVYVIAEHEWRPEAHEFIVMRVSPIGASLECPVCGRTSADGGEWSSPNAVGRFVIGLNPENCAGCHDTLTTHGIAPFEFRSDGARVPIPRPEDDPPTA